MHALSLISGKLSISQTAWKPYFVSFHLIQWNLIKKVVYLHHLFPIYCTIPKLLWQTMFLATALENAERLNRDGSKYVQAHILFCPSQLIFRLN